MLPRRVIPPSIRLRLLRPASISPSPAELRCFSASPPPPPPPSPDDPQTHFGFSQIPLSEKESRVRGVFRSVADSYDAMNDLMSLSVHRAWKASLVRSLSPTRAMRVLDVAGGTADVAMRVVDARGRGGGAAGGPVVVLDVNEDMLRVGEKRARGRGYGEEELRFVQGDAEALPVESASVDVYVISFGMRNVPRPEVALAEAVRVLRPGGRFAMLEFARVRNPALKAAYDAYSFNVIPALGGLVAGDSESYRYLVESIRKFPGQEEFAAMMREAGLTNVSVEDYSQGIAALYSGFKSVDDAPLVKDAAKPSVSGVDEQASGSTGPISSKEDG